ncbi:MAG: thiamine pyrophosphate-binding protein [Kiritimatiellae bacterium]|nr:thiamine pyrophosphate-binding protein [Kiritimatiellia bacterium]
MSDRQLMSGNEAAALGARHVGCVRGTGYPGTPSTEILEHFSRIGGSAAWSPNEKVAAEVALGVAMAGGRAMTTMKHVGLNVASDVLYTAAYSTIPGSLVFIVADDPGLASSQNEQDTRRHAIAAGVPVLDPADPQEAYDFTRLAFQIAARWHLPVIVRLTTRVSHTAAAVAPRTPDDPPATRFERDIPGRVMVPGHARPAHRALRQKLEEVRAWNEAEGPQRIYEGTSRRGIVANGVACLHAREADPRASVFKVGMSHPAPIRAILDFLKDKDEAFVVEENDPVLAEAIRAEGGRVPWNPPSFRRGELTVGRVRRLLAGEPEPETPAGAGQPPRLCPSCPHGYVFDLFRRVDCIVAGDIGCYTLAALPPRRAMDTQLCMGASIGVGLGLRHALPEPEARRVVSVIGDSTFMHSGLTGVAEMVYNPPPTGHVLVVLDNAITAMTGRQEHPGSGYALNHAPAHQIRIEDVCRAMGVPVVEVFDPVREMNGLESALRRALGASHVSVLIARRPCLLSPSRERAASASKPKACAGEGA